MFILHREGVDVSDIRAELSRAKGAWNIDKTRKALPVLRESDCIFLRALKVQNGVIPFDTVASTDTPLIHRFPATMRLVRSVSTEMGAKLGRVLFTRLEPGGRVYAHTDTGKYYDAHRRLHLVVESEGCPFTCGSETRTMQVGQIWEFDNKKMHHTVNTGSAPRIHLIFDVSTPAG